MRALRITILVCTAALAVAPASALARHRSHHRRHRHAVHHAQVRRERFGSDSTAVGTPQSGEAQNVGNAGTVQSFTGGVLTIALMGGGGTVSGTVNSSTELRCETPEPAGMETEASDSRSDGGGDNSGSRDTNSGPDEGSGNSGEDNGSSDDGNDNAGAGAGACSTIAPGMVVRSAELSVSGAGSVWNEVELVSQP